MARVGEEGLGSWRYMHIWLLFYEAGFGIDIRVIIIVYGFGSTSICDTLGLLFT